MRLWHHHGGDDPYLQRERREPLYSQPETRLVAEGGMREGFPGSFISDTLPALPVAELLSPFFFLTVT